MCEINKLIKFEVCVASSAIPVYLSTHIISSTFLTTQVIGVFVDAAPYLKTYSMQAS